MPVAEIDRRTDLIVDIGKSGTRGRLTHCGAVFEAATAGLPPHVAGAPGAGAALAVAVSTVWELVVPCAGGLAPEGVDAVVVGSTSIPCAEEVELFTASMRRLWPRSAIVLAEDGVVAHAAALGGPGVVASIGTGTVVTGIGDDGGWHRRDGWGPDLGDRGSGAWLGTEGLRAAFAALDRAGPATSLLPAAQEHLGATDLAAATRLLARPDRVAVLAHFARRVCAIAQTGDPVAEALVQRATNDAAATIRAVARDTATTQVVVVGRLGGDPVYAESLARHLAASGERLIDGRGGPLDVAPLLLFSAPYAAVCRAVIPSVRQTASIWEDRHSTRDI